MSKRTRKKKRASQVSKSPHAHQQQQPTTSPKPDTPAGSKESSTAGTVPAAQATKPNQPNPGPTKATPKVPRSNLGSRMKFAVLLLAVGGLVLGAGYVLQSGSNRSQGDFESLNNIDRSVRAIGWFLLACGTAGLFYATLSRPSGTVASANGSENTKQGTGRVGLRRTVQLGTIALIAVPVLMFLREVGTFDDRWASEDPDVRAAMTEFDEALTTYERLVEELDKERSSAQAPALLAQVDLLKATNKMRKIAPRLKSSRAKQDAKDMLKRGETALKKHKDLTFR